MMVSVVVIAARCGGEESGLLITCDVSFVTVTIQKNISMLLRRAFRQRVNIAKQ